MEQNALEYSDNDISVTAQSTLHMTIYLRGATDLLASDGMSPAPSRSLPFRPTSCAVTPIEMPYNPRSFNAVCETRQGELASGTFSHTTSYRPSMPDQVEIPTFLFGRPPMHPTNTKTRQPRVATDENQPPVLWACGGYATDRSEEESETEYDAATTADFRLHLNVIDCSRGPNSLSRMGQEVRNSALMDYELQLRLLEQQNRRRLMQAKDERHIDAGT